MKHQSLQALTVLLTVIAEIPAIDPWDQVSLSSVHQHYLIDTLCGHRGKRGRLPKLERPCRIEYQRTLVGARAIAAGRERHSQPQHQSCAHVGRYLDPHIDYWVLSELSHLHRQVVPSSRHRSRSHAATTPLVLDAVKYRVANHARRDDDVQHLTLAQATLGHHELAGPPRVRRPGSLSGLQ